LACEDGNEIDRATNGDAVPLSDEFDDENEFDEIEKDEDDRDEDECDGVMGM
jgi:hypothetical protein